MKATQLITSTSESMISAFTALQRAQSFAYGLACHTGGGSWEHPLTESETETGLGFESLYRVAGSNTRMLRKKNFMRLFKNFSLFKIISGAIGHFGALISALHQNTKQSYI